MTPNATHPNPTATPRDVARQLVDQGLSNRSVAAQVGVSEATIRRWRKDDAPPTHPETRDDAPTDAVVVPLDDDIRQALAVLAEGGYDPAAALRMCAQFVAGALTHSWDHNVMPRGVIPPMRVQFKPRA